MSVKISVIIPAHNEEDQIQGLADSFRKQTVTPLEMILVDDASTDQTVEMASSYFRVIALEKNIGPGAARNVAMAQARGNCFAFIDADCRPYPDWIEQIEKIFLKKDVDVITGGTRVKAVSFLGKSIAALGFPGGGALGFEKMWRVAPDGSVTRISSGNFAVRKEVIEKFGGFDETFTYYCEDAWFAHCLSRAGVKIKYVPEMDILHDSLENLAVFIRWHLNRGKGNYVFKQKIGQVGGFIRLRIWSTKNLIKTYYKDIKLPLMLVLLGLSFICQQIGFFSEKLRHKQ